jgi:hypothetical protein
MNLGSFSVISNFVALDAATDPVLNGPAGAVTAMEFNSGSSLTCSGPDAKPLVFRTAARSPSEALFACSSYGLGRVAMIGDSSPPDDGTGDTGDTLFNGWFAEVGGDHADIIINACLWLNPAPQPPACPADINGDGSVNGSDLALLLQSWGACAKCAADIDPNGSIDGADLALLLQSWGACN